MSSEILYNRVISSRSANGGSGYIAGELPTGIVTVNSAPSAREVEVRERRTRAVVEVTLSAADGTYRINNLDLTKKFDVIARDYAGVYNDVIVSRVTPEPY